MSDQFEFARLAIILADKHGNTAASPYSTLTDPEDSPLVAYVKQSFAAFADRMWGVSEEDLAQDCHRVVQNAQDQNTHIAEENLLIREAIHRFDYSTPGLTPQDYENYRTALQYARDLSRDPREKSTQDLIIKIVDECQEMDKQIHNVSHAFRENITTLVDSVTGYIDDYDQFVPGITSARPNDIRKQQMFQAVENETGDPYGMGIEEWEAARSAPGFFAGFMQEPEVQDTLTRLIDNNLLKIKNIYEIEASGVFSNLLRSRRNQYDTEGHPVRRFINSYEGIINTDRILRNLIIGDFGRSVYGLLNGETKQSTGLKNIFYKILNRAPKIFIGLKNRGGAQAVQKNIFILAQILSTAQSQVTGRGCLNLAPDNLNLSVASAQFREFVIQYIKSGLITNGLVDQYNAIARDGINAEGVSDQVRLWCKRAFRLYVNGLRHQAFTGFVNGLGGSANYLATSYDPRFILRHWHVPDFGRTYGHLIDRKIAMLGDGLEQERRELLAIKAQLGDRIADPVRSIIGTYYHLEAIAKLLLYKTNPLCASGDDSQTVLEMHFRETPDPLSLFLLTVSENIIKTSEWLEEPTSIRFGNLTIENLLREPLNKINIFIALNSGNYHGSLNAGLDVIAAKAIDNACMNYVLRPLYEMSGLYDVFVGAPHINKIHVLRDWANKGAEVMMMLILLGPDMARCSYGVSKNLLRKSKELLPDLDPNEEMYYYKWVQKVCTTVFADLREKFRNHISQYEGGAIGHGSDNFLTDPKWDIPGGARLTADVPFGHYDSAGNPVFCSFEGYVYDPGNTLGDPEIPSGTYVQTSGGKNFLKYVRLSPQKVKWIFERENAKRQAANRSPLRMTDIMPMTNSSDPRNPGVIGIGLKDGQVRTTPQYASHGDTQAGLEPLGMRTLDYMLGFSFSPITVGPVNDELHDPTMILDSDPPFPTLRKTSEGDITYQAAIIVQGYDKNTQRFTTQQYTPDVVNDLVVTFNSNASKIAFELAAAERKSFSDISSALQTFERWLKDLSATIEHIDQDFHSAQRPKSHPRSSIRATPDAPVVSRVQGSSQDPRMVPGRAYLSVGTPILAMLDQLMTSAGIEDRLEAGMRALQDAQQEMINLGSFFGHPETVEISQSLSTTSVARNDHGVPFHEMYGKSSFQYMQPHENTR